MTLPRLRFVAPKQSLPLCPSSWMSGQDRGLWAYQVFSISSDSVKPAKPESNHRMMDVEVESLNGAAYGERGQANSPAGPCFSRPKQAGEGETLCAICCACAAILRRVSYGLHVVEVCIS